MPFRKFALAIWALAIVAVTVLALLPIQHLQLPVFNWWDKAQHALAFVVHRALDTNCTRGRACKRRRIVLALS
jgi:hypothetical protein